MTVSERPVSVATRGVPHEMTDPLHVPRERYFAREFYELEKEKLWPHVWQMACRLEEIPRAGDYVEYEVCDQSILVVRQQDGSVKAFENACRHRATQLAVGTGRMAGGQIVCPFHGWRWSLDGTNTFVYQPEQFSPECMDPDDLRLRECQVDTWGGCVWINMDPDARPLQEALAPAAGILDGLGVANMRVRFWKEVILNANWKMAQEAFLEAFHVMQTHPQLTMGAGEDYRDGVIYKAFENGHGQFYGGVPTEKVDPDIFIEFSRILWEGQDAMTLERQVRLFEGLRNTVPPEEDFAAAAIQAVYEHAAGADIPMPPIENAYMWGGEVFLFPNFLMLPQYSNCLSYLSRPYNDDPEWCRFELWSLETYPVGQEPAEPPVRQRYEKEDTEHWGLIPRQDFSNIERQQKGLHTRHFVSTRLGTDWERIISNMHQELDRCLAA